ncbi:MAG TPA: CoA transferase, partial [Burkholderiaceae bacterium]|nr:CoA transferase [Burkholderiaceae bacterium]
MTRNLPLTGVRVIDFGQLTAGANTSAMLADLGADVIKIESPANLDLFRAIGAPDRGADWWNRSPPFRFSNRNKRSIALDLKSAEGLAQVRELIARSDVVVENFRRGVLERLGLDYARLRELNPRVVLASISSQGETGPNRLHASFGSTLDATGGLAALTGYAEGDPQISGSDVNYPDQVVSLISAGLILAALKQVRSSGQGTRLDISQREIVSFLIGEEIVAAGADPARQTQRAGNREAGVLLQDCFRCADGRWLALSV